MNYKQLKDDKYIKDWLSGIGAKKTTREGYIDSMRAFTEFLDKTPEQIILESEEDIRSGKLMRERRIFNDLREFREDLELSNAAPMSIKARLTGVRSFFNFYNITLPILPRSATSARPLLENRAVPTKEDFREILDVADVLEKALVLTGVSSGLAVNEISNLTVKGFMDGYDKETEITTLHLVREKVGYEFYTFLNPEASRAVWAYLEYRGRTSDSKDKVRQNQLLKQRVRYDRRGNSTGYLFINRAIPDEYLEIKNEKEAEELRKLSPKSIQKAYRELNLRARKLSPFGKRNLVRSHGARKLFYSTLLANGADIFFVDFVSGHQVNQTQDAYYRADPIALKKKYEKYIPWLTIKKELNVTESTEYKKVISENEVLVRETAKATVERVELIELRKKMDAVPQTVDDQIQKLMESKLEELVEARLNDLLKGVK